ncbi:hypothetical protein WICPIJ_008383 [Wickerhamomyces pijperi]|uniref:Uncharacterized protein n=1 Tax=Wickerhamomyces pijperi TaxID=599730 RepID=A0A9P8PZ12_WICPI|nr:hypothetical protein WICPIJ_008383 [Wickerhamomyces pijperi]
MSAFPAKVNGQPPVISLSSYDEAEWAKNTAIDLNTDMEYVVVDIVDDSHEVVAKIRKEDNETLDKIFKSAKEQFVQQQK